MAKQVTGKRDDTPLHSAARAGNLAAVKELLSGSATGEALVDLLCKQNQVGETPLFVAAEYGYVDVVRHMIMHHDASMAGIKAKNGFDALHIAAKQGDVGIITSLITGILYQIALFFFSCEILF